MTRTKELFSYVICSEHLCLLWLVPKLPLDPGRIGIAFVFCSGKNSLWNVPSSENPAPDPESPTYMGRLVSTLYLPTSVSKPLPVDLPCFLHTMYFSSGKLNMLKVTHHSVPSHLSNFFFVSKVSNISTLTYGVGCLSLKLLHCEVGPRELR